MFHRHAAVRRAGASRWARRLAATAIWVTLAGCESRSATAPSNPGVDPTEVSVALAALEAAFGTPAIQSLTALGGLMDGSAAPPAGVASAAASCAPARSADIALAMPPLATAGLIADSLRGRVFVYDTTLLTYRIGADSGGPPAGVRFVLYRVDPYARPIRPLSPDGWLDLTDTGAREVHVQIIEGAAVNADYRVSLAGTQAADTAVLTGTVTGGGHSFTLLDSTASAGFAATHTARVSDSTANVHVVMRASRVSFDPFDFSDSLNFHLAHAAHDVGLAGEIVTYCLLPSIGLTVSVDGAAYASVTNGGATPNVTGRDGQPLSAGEAQAILDLKDAQQQLFRRLVAFLAPPKLLLPRN